MPAWLFKTEPSTYSFADLQRDKKTVWEGVKNPTALQHIRKVKRGDAIYFYHTGSEKCIVGLARAASAPYPDPKASAAEKAKLAVVDLEPARPVPKMVTLAQLKADARFKTFDLVRISRLSVMPVPKPLEKALREMLGLA